MTKRLLLAAALLAAALLAAALGLAACDTSNAFCYGEGGQVQACTSQGSSGSLR